MNSPLPIPCHQPSSSISSSEALSHALKTEDFVTPYAYEQHFNHHLCFDPNLQQPDGLNVTGLMRIMPFQRPYQQTSYMAGPYHSNGTSLPLPYPYDPVTTLSMFQPLPLGTITFGQPHGLHDDTLLMPPHCSPDNLSPHHTGSQTTSGADGHGGIGGGDQLYREELCEGVTSSVNPSPPMSLVEEEHGCVVRDIKRRRTGSLSSDQEDQDTQSYPGNYCHDGVFPSGGGGEKFSCSGAIASLKWQPHLPDSWSTLCDDTLHTIPPMEFRVEADKGFVFSVGDDSYVCQKKNHFQISAHVVFHKVPKYVKLKDNDEFHPIEVFMLMLHGVKFESVDSTIQLEQSLPDRSKVTFEPVVVEVPDNPDKPVRTTICRLHFSETTASNMRKRGKPNPDQKHFCVVVSLCARTGLGTHMIVSQVSERIIVRASNPGHFDNDCDYMWLKSSTGSDAIYHHGKVGINTEKPEEALTVNGHIQLTGQLLQLSDVRLKRNVTRADPAHMLENISKLQLYEYQLACGDQSSQGGHLGGGAQSRREIGVLAQELSVVIPDAVQQTDSSMTLPDGTTVPKVLVVSKERVFMETVGAVQELAKSMSLLERRIAEIAAIQQRSSNCTHCQHNKLGVLLTQSLGRSSSQHVSSYLFPFIILSLLFALSFVLFVVCFR